MVYEIDFITTLSGRMRIDAKSLERAIALASQSAEDVAEVMSGGGSFWNIPDGVMVEAVAGGDIKQVEKLW